MFELSDLKQTRVYQEALAEGEARGEVKLAIRQLNRRFGDIPQNLTEKIRELSIEEIENLGEALLDFQSLSDLVSWLER
jgi:predicted transposase YdaD